MSQSIRHLLFLVALLGLSSCATTDATDRSTAITYARYSPHGLPAYEVRIFGDRSAIYEGKANAKTLGTREFRLTDAQYQRLLTGLREADFATMDDTYGLEHLGPTSLLVSANLGSRSPGKTVRAASFPIGWPQRLFTLMWNIEDALDLEQLVCPVAGVDSTGAPVELCKFRREIEEKAYGRAR